MLSETHIFQGCACADLSTKGAWSRRALTKPRDLEFDSKAKFLCIIVETFSL